jgi:hypothetical protein
MPIRKLLAVAAFVPALTNVAACEPSICQQFANQVAAEGCGESGQLNTPPVVDSYEINYQAPGVDGSTPFGHHTVFKVYAHDYCDPNPRRCSDDLYFEWDFDGNGVVDSEGHGQRYPTDFRSVTEFTYSRPGVYWPRLRITDFPKLLGVPGETILKMRVRVFTPAQRDASRAPTAAFTIPSGPILVGEEVRLDASASSDPEGDPLVYRWWVDDERDSKGLRVFHYGRTFSLSLPQEGCRAISLWVYDDYRIESERAQHVLCAWDPEHRPTPRLEVTPNPSPVDRAVTFSAFASAAGKGGDHIVSYEWDLDGRPGFEQRTTRDSALQSYSAPGRVRVFLRVTNQLGFSSVTDTYVQVGNPPRARLTIAPGTAHPGQEVTFDAGESSDPDGNIAKYEWDVDGDGGFDYQTSTPTLAWSFGTAGLYEAAVRVTDATGLQDTATKRVRVEGGSAPTAVLGVDPNPAFVGQTVMFQGGSSTDPDNDIQRWEWDLDGVAGYESSATSAWTSRRYDEPGTIVARLRVTDASGQTGEDTVTLRVLERPGVARAAVAKPRRPGKARPFSAVLSTRGADELTSARLLGGLGRLRARLGGPSRLTRAERQMRRFLRSRWRTQLRFAARPALLGAGASGLVLAQSGDRRAPQVCARLTVELRAKALPRGRLTILGGTGGAARLRGTATFRVRVDPAGAVTAVGNLRAGSGRPRPLPSACRRLAAR